MLGRLLQTTKNYPGYKILEGDISLIVYSIIATAHSQHFAAQNMLWALQHRMDILRMEWIGLERSIWARCR